MLQAELRVVSGKHVGHTIQLPAGKFLVGREEDCHLRPNSDLVSRHHCVFTLDEYGLRLRDLGSTNGSFVNGEQIRGAVVLHHGDAVSIGKLDFKVALGDHLGEETFTNLESELPTEVLPGMPSDVQLSDFEELLENSDPDTVSASDTLMEIPVQPAPALDDSQVASPSGDTQYFPPQGLPPQMPVGYPQQMGYPPGMMPYGYPGYPQQMGYPPLGYPQQPMGYPQGMYPQQFTSAPGEPEPAAPVVSEPEIRLPDPSQTGVKAPVPVAAEATGEQKDGRTADQKAKEEAPSAAADAIQQYLQRRPKTGK